MVYLGRRSRTKSDLSMKMYEEEIQVRNRRRISERMPCQSLVCRCLLTLATSRFSTSGIPSIRGKTWLSESNARSMIRIVPSPSRLPSQSLSSTHRLDLTVSTNAKAASGSYSSQSRHFLNANKPHYSRFSTREVYQGGKLVRENVR